MYKKSKNNISKKSNNSYKKNTLFITKKKKVDLKTKVKEWKVKLQSIR